jgi:2-dehydropantoate 2-reductase
MSTAHDAQAMPSPRWLQQVHQQAGAAPTLYAWSGPNLEQAVRPTRKTALRRSFTESAEVSQRRRIFVLGMGNLGRLFASSLMELSSEMRAPITLVVHRKSLLEEFIKSPRIEMTRAGVVHEIAGFDVEWWTEDKPNMGPVREIAPPEGGITDLIVATKAGDVMTQVHRLRRYLNETSTVAFVQNGMCKLWPPAGEAYNRVFPAARKPNWIACVTTHGVTSLGSFKSNHASPATVAVGPVLLNDSTDANDLMTRIAGAPELAGRQVTKRELWILQLEKLVVNSIINPLTAVLRCKNGELLVDRNDELPVLMDTLVRESSNLLTALVLDPSSDTILDPDETEGGSRSGTRSELLERFSYARLREMYMKVLYKVQENRSSMYQDVEARKQTEIDDFNGWLLETANGLTPTIELPTHQKLTLLVKDGAVLSRSQLLQHFQLFSKV